MVDPSHRGALRSHDERLCDLRTNSDWRERPMRRRRLLMLISAAALLGPTACGGNSSTGGAASPAPPGQPDKVTTGVIAIVDVAPIYLGKQQGFFSKRNIDLTLQTAQGGAVIVPSVVSGQYQFGFSNVT